MALKTVAQLKDSVAGILSGLDLSNVDNLDGALERGARVLVQKADIPEASGIQNIVLYSGVFNYACDPRIFGTAITDIRPQGISRPPSDYVYKRPGDQFDRTKGYLSNGTMTTFEYFNGQPIIRIVSKIPQQQVIIDQMNSITGWTAGGSASGLTQDNAVYYQAPASLRFNLINAGPELVTNGGFVGSTTGWTINNIASIVGWQYGSNSAEHVPNGADNSTIFQTLTTTPGRNYKILVSQTGTTGTVFVSLGGGGAIYGADTEEISFIQPATSSSDLISFEANPTLTGYDGSITNVSVKEITDTGTLTKTLTNSLNLSSYQGMGVAFLAIRIPDGADPTILESINLRLGSDSGNYSEVETETGFIGNWVAGEWLLVAFDFAQTTDIGTPNWSAINYVQTRFTIDGDLINFRVGGLWISQPSPAQILFQSAAIFKATGAPASTDIISNTDQILLNNPAYTLYEYESAIAILEQVGGAANDSTMASINKKLNGVLNTDDHGLYGFFRGDNPSQELRMVGNYYDDGPGYGGYTSNG